MEAAGGRRCWVRHRFDQFYARLQSRSHIRLQPFERGTGTPFSVQLGVDCYGLDTTLKYSCVRENRWEAGRPRYIRNRYSFYRSGQFSYFDSQNAPP